MPINCELIFVDGAKKSRMAKFDALPRIDELIELKPWNSAMAKEWYRVKLVVHVESADNRRCIGGKDSGRLTLVTENAQGEE